MKYCLVINTKGAETVWNALRFAATALQKGHRVSIFLMGPAVEIDSIGDAKFDVKKILGRFSELGGRALSCGTCLKLRRMDASEACPISSMDELVSLTEESDRTIVFG